ncbi:metal-dependent hydrolase [Pacificimonas flava]|nr:metal-dependent hydrolase [Pacificimonas flava]
MAHTLAGAALGEAGLKEKSGLGLATLMIAANIPDLDAIALVFGENLAFRRGLTHGPIGLLLLPVLLTLAMLGFDKWQARRGKRPPDRLPVRAGWLLLLAYIGALSHPALDFLNTYGVRCLAPFSDRWFYGDTLFIIDVWLWTVLAIGTFWAQRRRRGGVKRPRLPAQAAILILCAYIAGMGAFSAASESAARAAVAQAGYGTAELAIASPPPVDPFRRRLIYRTEDRRVGWGEVALGGPVVLDAPPRPDAMDDPRIAAAAAGSKPLRDFLFWSRVPFARFEGGEVIVSDARYTDRFASSNFTVRAPVSAADRE